MMFSQDMEFWKQIAHTWEPRAKKMSFHLEIETVPVTQPSLKNTIKNLIDADDDDIE